MHLTSSPSLQRPDEHLEPALIDLDRSAEKIASPGDMTDVAEKRGAYRHRVLKGATIIHGFRNSEMACLLRDQHPGGAQLHIASEAMVPSEFILYVPVDGTGYKAVLRWRQDDRAGVKFLGVEPKPRHHYG